MTFTEFTLTAGVVSDPPPPHAASREAAANAVTAQEALLFVIFEIKVYSVRLKNSTVVRFTATHRKPAFPGAAQGNYR
ncbi:hypothetical protein [Paracidovorax valerianellae]|uniref:hypothetical protein n=1 Tax=Paracidovorax valerianellae TaxID=187868 RepID=UPI001587EFBD|nr:hypothetical protein [Paracidovorax valerianellae]MDA8444258.1 hypothetical protein [Paracidovorax valerianellae]